MPDSSKQVEYRHIIPELIKNNGSKILPKGNGGYPCDTQHEVSRNIISTWHTPRIDFPTFMWGLFRLRAEEEQEFSLPFCWWSSCFALEVQIGQQGPKEAGEGENKKWERGRQRSKALKFQIRLLYGDAGGEWFQAADNGPTESILTFSLVIAQFAGWGQRLDLRVSQSALVVTAGGHLQ